MEVRPIRVVQYGLGASGKNIARQINQTPGLLLVGGIDWDPDLIGKDVGEVAEFGGTIGIPVQEDAASVLNTTHPDIVIVATRSSLNETYPQLAACLRARINVISTCEELVYPYAQHPQLAQNLDDLAQRSGVSLLGVGVNPGFTQDLLPLILTAPCTSVQRITATRVFNANVRRATLHQRIGAGLSREDFRRAIEAGKLPHVGLRESLQMIADRIGWRLDRIEERVEPIFAPEWVQSEFVTVAPGQVCGTEQIATGLISGQPVITLTWRVAVNVQENHDSIAIEGTPPIRMSIEGGLHGGHATPALVIHAISPTIAAKPGLHTVADMPPMHYRVPGFMNL